MTLTDKVKFNIEMPAEPTRIPVEEALREFLLAYNIATSEKIRKIQVTVEPRRNHFPILLMSPEGGIIKSVARNLYPPKNAPRDISFSFWNRDRDELYFKSPRAIYTIRLHEV